MVRSRRDRRCGVGPCRSRHHGGIVSPLTTAGVGERGGHGTHRFTAVFTRAVPQQAGQVGTPRSAFLHAAGAQHVTATVALVGVLSLVAALYGHAERQVGGQGDFTGPAIAQQERPVVDGVDELGAAAVQDDAPQLAGGEGGVAVAEEGLVGLAGLVGQVGFGARRAPREALTARVAM